MLEMQRQMRWGFCKQKLIIKVRGPFSALTWFYLSRAFYPVTTPFLLKPSLSIASTMECSSTSLPDGSFSTFSASSSSVKSLNAGESSHLALSHCSFSMCNLCLGLSHLPPTALNTIWQRPWFCICSSYFSSEVWTAYWTPPRVSYKYVKFS